MQGTLTDLVGQALSVMPYSNPLLLLVLPLGGLGALCRLPRFYRTGPRGPVFIMGAPHCCCGAWLIPYCPGYCWTGAGIVAA